MIYLVSRNKSLFGSNRYKEVPFKEAMEVLFPLHWVQFDTETEGLDAHTKKLLTVQLGNKDNQVVFDWQTLDDNEKLELKKYFESDRIFIGWNLMFDVGFLYVQDIWPKHLWDGMLADKLIFLGYPITLTINTYNELGLFGYLPSYDEKTGVLKHYELSYSLKSAAKRWCNIDIDKTVRGKIINVGLTEDVIVYAAGDVMWLEDIKAKQDEELNKQELQKALAFECEFIKPLAYAKYCGIHLNESKWLVKMEKDLSRRNKAMKALNEWVVKWDRNKEFSRIDLQMDLFSTYDPSPKCTINWSSPQQVIPLFERLGIKVDTFDKKTKKKKKSVEKEQLEPQKDDFPIIPLYLDYRGAEKVVKGYGQNWLNAINKKTGRIHVELHSIGTDTSRVSSGGGVYKLNLQNLPHDEETRACFTSEPGNVWISCDYSGQESCITASVSKDEKMCNILNTGGDLHSEVAKACWPDLLGKLTDKEVKEKYKSYRSNAKGVEFGIFYGGDAHTLHANKGFEMKEAERIYNSFMNEFPGIRIYQEYCRRNVMEKGYILMNPILKHRAHIYDFDKLKKVMESMKDPDYVDYYWEMKRINPSSDTVLRVKEFNKRQSESGRQAINYRIEYVSY